MTYQHIDLLIARYPVLLDLREPLLRAAGAIIGAYRAGNKLLVCGNGGSCADADHIVGELMKGFRKKRPLPPELRGRIARHDPDGLLADRLQSPLRAVSLGQYPALSTAFSNDVDARLVFAQQALGYTDAGDVLLGISTSGNAGNVCSAAAVAKALGAVVIALTGASGGRLAALCDILLSVPCRETYQVQELHLPIYHALCLEVEDAFFTE